MATRGLGRGRSAWDRNQRRPVARHEDVPHEDDADVRRPTIEFGGRDDVGSAGAQQARWMIMGEDDGMRAHVPRRSQDSVDRQVHHVRGAPAECRPVQHRPAAVEEQHQRDFDRLGADRGDAMVGQRRVVRQPVVQSGSLPDRRRRLR